MRDNRITGQIGEWVAYFYFLLRGYRVKRDQKLAGVQVDLVLRRKNTVTLVEVKTRYKKDDRYSAVAENQLLRLKTASKKMLCQNNTCSVSVDVFIVYLLWFKLEHHRNVCDIG